MAIENFFIFDSSGNCLFELKNPPKPDQQKILYGFLYSLKSFMNRMTPNLVKDNNFFIFSNSHYHLVFHEFPTSIKFVMLLSFDMGNDSDFYREVSCQIYRDIYVQYIVKNPAVEHSIILPVDADTPGQTGITFDCELFRSRLDQFFVQNSLI